MNEEAAPCNAAGQPEDYGVIGNPVGHSLSPRIHGLFAAQTGRSMRYRAVLSPLDAFAAAVEAFRRGGGRGLNVTLPFKEEAWEYADERTARADRVKAVNLLRFDGPGRVHGDSTDGAGLLRDLANHGIEVGDRRILLLGAGGAVRSVLGDLLDQSPAAVDVANRTPSRAARLVALFPRFREVLSARDVEQPVDVPYDLVINGTAAGLAGQRPPVPDGALAPGGCCYDMAYGAAAAPFLEWAAAGGAAVACDGLGMLVEQAAESFYLWCGERPRTAPVLAALKA